MSEASRSRSARNRSDRVLAVAVAVVALGLVAVSVATWWLLPREGQAPKTAYAQAIEQAEKAVAASPKTVMPRLELANVYFTYKQYDKAVSELEAARSVETTAARDKALIEISLARVAEVQGDLGGAKQHYKAALKHEKSFDAYYSLGAVERKTGKLDLAVSNWESALKMNPNAATLRIDLAEVFIELNRGADAVEQLKEAQRYLPGDPDIERLLTEASRGE